MAKKNQTNSQTGGRIIKVEFPLSVAASTARAIMNDDAVVYAIDCHGVCRLSELVVVAGVMPPQAPLYVLMRTAILFREDDIVPTCEGEGGASAVILTPTHVDRLSEVLRGEVTPEMLVLQRSDFEDIFDAMPTKPQRLWPALHRATGSVEFYGVEGAGFTAATLQQTLALGDVG